MAQALARMGSRSRSSRAPTHVLPREPPALGEALGEALAADGIELRTGVHAEAARRDGDDYVLELPGGEELRGDRLLVATGRRPRVDGLGLETVGIEPGAARHRRSTRACQAADGVWAIGDAAGIWPLTYVGKYQGRVAASNILGTPREANYDAVPRVVFTDPQAAAVGEADGALTATAPLAERRAHRDVHARLRHAARVPHARLRRRAADRRLRARAGGRRVAPAGDGRHPRARAARACWPTSIQPFPTFSESFVAALAGLRAGVPAVA